MNREKMTELVLWDWNGTLLDDLQACLFTINCLLKDQNKPLLDTERYRQVFSFPVEAYYARAGLDLSGGFDPLARRFMEIYMPLSMECEPVPGAEETLRRLQRAGKRQIILTASRRADIEIQLKKFPAADCFEEVLAMDNIYATGKQQAAGAFLARNELPPERVLMVGDTHHDLEIARFLGCRCALYAGGHQYLPEGDDYTAVDTLERICELAGA